MEHEQREDQFTSLIDNIRSFMARYVVLPSAYHSLVLAIWVIHTWLFEAAYTTPYLYINGPKASGKTRLLDVLGILCRNGRRADDMTPPVMFKLIERELPTLMIDEVDTIWSGSRNEPKRRILNTGYKLGGCAWREQARELVKFSTFCAKIIAGIKNGYLPDTVGDRCIPIEMTSKGKGQDCERFNEYHVAKSLEVEMILSQIWTFHEDFLVDVTAQRPEPLAALSDRQNEISEPLLAIANVLGMEAELREALQKIFRSASGQKTAQQIILDRIRTSFGEEAKMFTEDLCTALGPSYNGRQLALWLEPFGVGPRDIRIGSRVAKGYKREDFEPVWTVNLDPVHTPEQSEEVAA